MRGPGDFFGTAQSGFIDSKIARFITDVKLLNTVMEVAKDILKKDPDLKEEINLPLRKGVKRMFENFKK